MSKNNANAVINTDWMNDWQRPAGAEEISRYAVIQWFNGDQDGDSPVLKSGGWELPVKWFEQVIGDGLPAYEVEHSGARSGTEPAYLLPVIHIAAVMKHVSYYRGKVRVWSAEYHENEGWKSQVRLLCFVKEIEAFKPMTPVVVTYHSTTAGEFNALAKQFRAEVISTADRLAAKIAKERSQEAPQKFLPHAFWLPVGAKGKLAKVGKKGEDSKYAPMVGYWDSAAVTAENPDEVMAALQALATPPDIRQFVAASFYEEAKIWLDGERQKLARKISGDVAETADAEGEAPFPVVEES